MKSITAAFRTSIKGIIVPLFAAVLSGCGDSSAVEDVLPESGSSFTAKVSGDLEFELTGQKALAGVMYKRYHINMASHDPAGVQPMVVIAFGNSDTATPTSGTYPLAAETGFRGTVEIYSEPQRDFSITSGELIITAAKDNVLTGTFTLSAKEAPEEYGGPSAVIKVEGAFTTKSAKK